MKRLLAGIAAAMVSASASVSYAAPTVLSRSDVTAYAAAFAAVRQGEFEAFEALIKRVHDRCLQGRLAYLKLMHADHHAEFAELKTWLDRYKDQPDASNVYALAKKRRPGSALETLAAGGGSLTESSGTASLTNLAKPKAAVDPKLQAAREAFYNDGDLKTAFALATKSGERWVGGLAAYRLGRYGTAVERFSSLSKDATQSEWVRSGAAFWAARASIADGEPEKALDYLKLAAKDPYTFYGLIAERQLGLDPGVSATGVAYERDDPAGAAEGVGREALTAKALARFVKSDPRAKRAVAFVQVGQGSDAYEELRLALFSAGSASARSKWKALAGDLGLSLASAAAPAHRSSFDVASYQGPDLSPLGGYTQERALVYAIVRQESGFNPSAASPAGAYGLMQMTPATAAFSEEIDNFSDDFSLLLDPSVNLRLGQDYVARLLAQTQGDLLLTVAAYNAGPKGISKLAAAMPDADSLLLVESLAGPETRAYVQKVMANYWIYRRLFNQPSPTLDAAAAGAKTVLASIDQSPISVSPPPPALASPSAGLGAISAQR